MKIKNEVKDVLDDLNRKWMQHGIKNKIKLIDWDV